MIRIQAISALAFAVTGLFSAPLAAQSLSAADILAKIEEKVGGVNEYQALLNDPDPARSMAAMEVMLESGDSKLVRMALDFGLYSPNPVVQRMALEGFFASGPILNIYFGGEAASKEQWFRVSIVDYLQGSVNSSGVGYAAFRVGKFDAGRKCYSSPRDADQCMVFLSDTGVSIVILEKVGSLKLNEAGELVGEITLPHVDSPATLRIPVSN